MADRPRQPQWAKAHRAYVASPTIVLIRVNTRNNKQIWHHHNDSNCNMSTFSSAVVWIIVLENLWDTFVAYSARWRGVSFCYIRIGRSNMWPWIEVILLWRLKGVALNLLRPGDNEKSLGFLFCQRVNNRKSLGFYGGRVFANIRKKYVSRTYCAHDQNNKKTIVTWAVKVVAVPADYPLSHESVGTTQIQGLQAVDMWTYVNIWCMQLQQHDR